MYYVYNVIKYLSNMPCNYDTLIDDIDSTFKAIKVGKSNQLIIDFINHLNIYVQARVEDCARFASFLSSEGYPLHYKMINEYYFMPFRFAKYPMADQRILEHALNIENLTIENAVLALLSTRYTLNKEMQDAIWFFFKGVPNDHIEFNTIGNAPRLGQLGNMPLSSDQMIQEYLSLRTNPNNPNAYKIIGNYGELMFYMYLINKYDDTQVMWVSRDLGDGFGFDLALYDIEKNFVKLYEIKTTTVEGATNDISLTQHELNICNSSLEQPNEEYHIIGIQLANPINMTDIDIKNDKVIDLMNPDKEKILIKNKNDSYTVIHR